MPRQTWPLDEVLTLRSVQFAFPAKGIGCEYWSEVEGQCVKQAVQKGQVIKWSDLEFDA
ncbi:SAF domain-containing protein [Thiomicrorhabdus sp.]|uniref:SAF domain-containing protein n=1 Tax=Thiomicrorhabdus sp. TaxID=2039724 RepID=UPI0029C945C5|nr:hypothetical protein [Thiomicrorhabdus sp.]